MFVFTELKCGRCSETFKNEYPFLAHCRFQCHQRKDDSCVRLVYEHKQLETKKQHRVTDFHNIARDLEHKQSGVAEEAEISPKKRKCDATLHPKWRKTVLSEKTNIANADNILQLVKDCDQTIGSVSSSEDKLKGELVKVDRKSDGLAEVVDANGTFTHDAEVGEKQEKREGFGVRSSSNSAFSLVISNNHGEQKSAFCKPSKRTSPLEPSAHLSGAPTVPPSRIEDMPDGFTPRRVLGYNNLMAPSILSSDLQTVASPVGISNAFHYAPEQWCRNIGAQLHAASTLTILPPTFTSFGVSAQNWCAKCNLSFRMTSDLVFHMRSHHKKEFAAESQVRRRREEKLTCPICHEFFRERHHLSRHMTSHN